MASKAGQTFVDLLERCGWTFVQLFIATWLVLQEKGGGYDVLALKIAGSAAAIGAVKVLVLSGFTPHPGGNPALDTLKRVGWTVLIGAAGAWLGLELDGGSWNAAIAIPVATNAGLLALGKCILALNFGQKHSASSLPAALDPVPPDPYLDVV